MKYKVELLSALAYTDKKTNEPKTRIGYRLLEDQFRQDTKNLKGYSELSYYIDGHDVFNELKATYFGVVAELEISTEPSKSNPLKSIQVLKSITVGENVINIL